jgi:twitching motility protein PilT
MPPPRARRIDTYVDHVTKHRARALMLESDKPALFRFTDGDKSTSTPISHSQIAAAIREIASSEENARIDAGGRVELRYVTSAGTEVRLSVTAADPSSWRVVLAVVEGSPEAPVDQGSKQATGQLDSITTEVDVEPAHAEDTRRAAAHHPPAAEASGRPVVSSDEPRVFRYLRQLVELEGSDLHLSAGEPPRARIHGEIRPLEPRHPRLSDAELRKLLYEILPPRALDQFERLRDADFGTSIEGLARFRANYFEDRKGMGAVFRQIPYEIVSPEQLGLPKSVLDLCWLSKGLVVVTGPTGSGKSTTLASLIDFVNRNRSDHIVTIEDPIEFVHENRKCLVNQREVGTHTENFKNALRAALREDPDIVLVGEMRDLETIAIAIETAETGHLVFGTLHTTTAASTVDRIIDQFPSDRQDQIRAMLSESLRGVIAQVLCKKIGGGRVAAFEVLLTNPAVSNLIREAKSYQLTSVMQTGRSAGMQTMNDHLFELVRSKQVAAKEAYIKSTDKSSFKELLTRSNIKLDLSAE